MSVVLMATLAAVWLAVSVVFLAACIGAGRADRLAARNAAPSAGASSDELRLIQREILRG